MKNKNGDVQLRQFRPKDLAAVHELVVSTIAVSYRPDYTPEVVEFFKSIHPPETILSDAENGYTVVAAEDGEIVGTGTLLGTNVRRVFIDPARQHQGIGSLIYNELEKRACEKGLDILDLSSALGARTFWERHGYSVREEHFTPTEDGRIIHYYTMTKIINTKL
jgi:GNAT superfamily N-acetyltransferase